jgi:hypothetical protein
MCQLLNNLIIRYLNKNNAYYCTKAYIWCSILRGAASEIGFDSGYPLLARVLCGGQGRLTYAFRPLRYLQKSFTTRNIILSHAS